MKIKNGNSTNTSAAPKRRLPLIAVAATIALLAAALLFILGNNDKNNERILDAKKSNLAKSDSSSQANDPDEAAAKAPTPLKQEVQNDNTVTVYYDGNDERDSTDIKSFTAADDLNTSWTITDPEKIKAVEEWIGSFEGSHTPSAEAENYEVSVDRYKICAAGREIKLNYYDYTAVIIDSDCYVGTAAADYSDLLDIVLENPDLIRAITPYSPNNPSEVWDIKDADVIEEFTTSIEEIADTYEGKSDSLAAGGTMPTFSYKYNGLTYRVQLRENSEANVIVEKSKGSDRIGCMQYHVDSELVEHLNNLVSKD